MEIRAERESTELFEQAENHTLYRSQREFSIGPSRVAYHLGTSEGLEVGDESGGIADNFSRAQSSTNAEALTEVLGNHYAIDRATRPRRQ